MAWKFASIMLLVSSLLLGTASVGTGKAHSPSFACVASSSASEHVICADEELAAQDREITLLYPLAKKSGLITIPKQRAWIAKRNACGADRECLLKSYSNWPVFPWPTGFGDLFARQAKNDTGELEIKDIGGGWFAFSVSAIHMVMDKRGRFLTANDGEEGGIVKVSGGRGRYGDDAGDGCIVDFARMGNGHWILIDNGECGGLGVTLNGEYRPALKRHR